MKKWNEQTPLMSSAALMKTYRQQLWDDMKEHPEWSSSQVVKVQTQIADLTKAINKRSYNPDKVLQLIHEVERQRRIYARVSKKLKISKRAAKFAMKQIRKTGKPKQKPTTKQIEIFN